MCLTPPPPRTRRAHRRSFQTSSGVTAIDFSSSAPNILALGLYNGNIAVYDVRLKQSTPSRESDATTGKHSDPVWKVRAGVELASGARVVIAKAQ